ncbi:hypothetical protein AAMO2058_001019400 [Amorphochlora amoebiformis]
MDFKSAERIRTSFLPTLDKCCDRITKQKLGVCILGFVMILDIIVDVVAISRITSVQKHTAWCKDFKGYRCGIYSRYGRFKALLFPIYILYYTWIPIQKMLTRIGSMMKSTKACSRSPTNPTRRQSLVDLKRNSGVSPISDLSLPSLKRRVLQVSIDHLSYSQRNIPRDPKHTPKSVTQDDNVPRVGTTTPTTFSFPHLRAIRGEGKGQRDLSQSQSQSQSHLHSKSHSQLQLHSQSLSQLHLDSKSQSHSKSQSQLQSQSQFCSHFQSRPWARGVKALKGGTTYLEDNKERNTAGEDSNRLKPPKLNLNLNSRQMSTSLTPKRAMCSQTKTRKKNINNLYRATGPSWRTPKKQKSTQSKLGRITEVYTLTLTLTLTLNLTLTIDPYPKDSMVLGLRHAE